MQLTIQHLIADAEKKGYTGFAKTLKAYELLLNLNLTYTNGIRVDVADPNNLGPILVMMNQLQQLPSYWMKQKQI